MFYFIFVIQTFQKELVCLWYVRRLFVSKPVVALLVFKFPSCRSLIGGRLSEMGSSRGEGLKVFLPEADFRADPLCLIT